LAVDYQFLFLLPAIVFYSVIVPPTGGLRSSFGAYAPFVSWSITLSKVEKVEECDATDV
jgi:hypothetical protein